MSLNATSWATAITTAMDNAHMFDDLIESEKDDIYDAWKIVCQGHINHITNNANVSTTGVTGTGSPGGPLPITAQPGTIS